MDKFEKIAEGLLKELDLPIGAAQIRQSIVNGERTLILESDRGVKLDQLPKSAGGYPVIHRTRKTGLARN